MIVYSLQDPIQNLMLAAKLLRRLIEIDWGNIAADEMTKEQVMLTSLRYSRSPGISLELLKEVLKNEPYKSESYDKMRRLFSE